MERAVGPVPEGAPERDILDTSAAGPAAVRGGTLRVAGYAGGAALTVLSAALLARHLGPADLGRYRTVISLVTIVAGVTEAGMTSLGVREYATLAPSLRDRMMRALLGLRLTITFAGVAVAVGFSMLAGYTGAMVVGTVLAGIGVALTILQGTYAIPLQVNLRLGWVSALEFARQALLVVALVVLIVVGAGLAPLLGAAIPGALLLLAVTLPLVVGRMPLLPAFDAATWREMLRVTLPFAAATAVGVVYAYLTVVVLSLVASEDEVGYFGGAFSMFVTLTAIPGLLVASTFPILARAARDDRTRLDYALQRLTETSLVLGVGLGLLTLLVAPFAVEVVLGPEFDPAIPVLRLQGAALLSTFLVAVGGFALLSLRRHRALLVSNLLALIASLATTLALAGPLGAEAGGIAILVAESVLAIAYGVSLRAAGHPLRTGRRVAAGTALALAAAIAVSALLSFAAVPSVLAGGAVFAALILATRALPAEVAEALLRRRAAP